MSIKNVCSNCNSTLHAPLYNDGRGWCHECNSKCGVDNLFEGLNIERLVGYAIDTNQFSSTRIASISDAEYFVERIIRSYGREMLKVIHLVEGNETFSSYTSCGITLDSFLTEEKSIEINKPIDHLIFLNDILDDFRALNANSGLDREMMEHFRNRMLKFEALDRSFHGVYSDLRENVLAMMHSVYHYSQL